MRALFLFFTLLSLGYAKSYIVSTITPPKNVILDVDENPCDEACLKKYIEEEQIFSFLSKYKNSQNKELLESYMIFSSILNLEAIDAGDDVRFALLIPYKKIGRYVNSTTKSVIAYLSRKNVDYHVKTYFVEDEKVESIQTALKAIEEDKFKYIIAPLTIEGGNNLASINPQMYVYIPTVHKSDINSSTSSLYYGAIDYKKQIQKLLELSNDKIAVFKDNSIIGNKLTNYLKEDKEKLVLEKTVSSKSTNLRRVIRYNRKLNKSTIFLNTPIIKSGYVLSQLTLYDKKDNRKLSTQINYDPLLLSLTQNKDRKNFYIANSIKNDNIYMIESNNLLNNDIEYDWINYSTTLGIDFFFSMITSTQREYGNGIEEFQMQYEIEYVKPTYSRFVKIGSEDF